MINKECDLLYTYTEYEESIQEFHWCDKDKCFIYFCPNDCIMNIKEI